MRTLRHFFVTESLDEVEKVEKELTAQGVSSAHFHVLSRDEAGMANRGLNSLGSLLRRDLWISGLIGAATGLALASLILLAAGLLGLAGTPAGWTPFIFLAIVIFGFCTWEGGLYGIQEPNRAFEQFHKELDLGRHVIFVDAQPGEKNALLNVMQDYKAVVLKQIAVGRPAWIMRLANRWRQGVDRNVLSQEQF